MRCVLLCSRYTDPVTTIVGAYDLAYRDLLRRNGEPIAPITLRTALTGAPLYVYFSRTLWPP